jgi:hypothetical protein
MTMKSFIQEHRQEIDQAINSVVYRYDGNGGRGRIPEPPPKHNDRERREWIMNEEGLYNWAKSEGVRV